MHYPRNNAAFLRLLWYTFLGRLIPQRLFRLFIGFKAKHKDNICFGHAKMKLIFDTKYLKAYASEGLIIYYIDIIMDFDYLRLPLGVSLPASIRAELSLANTPRLIWYII